VSKLNTIIADFVLLRTSATRSPSIYRHTAYDLIQTSRAIIPPVQDAQNFYIHSEASSNCESECVFQTVRRRDSAWEAGWQLLAEEPMSYEIGHK
jgi:hypothetical protein